MRPPRYFFLLPALQMPKVLSLHSWSHKVVPESRREATNTGYTLWEGRWHLVFFSWPVVPPRLSPSSVQLHCVLSASSADRRILLLLQLLRWKGSDWDRTWGQCWSCLDFSDLSQDKFLSSQSYRNFPALISPRFIVGFQCQLSRAPTVY